VSILLFAGLVARKQGELILARFAATPMTAQLIDFGAKGFDVLKAAVDGREAHIPTSSRCRSSSITMSPTLRDAISRSPKLRSL